MEKSTRYLPDLPFPNQDRFLTWRSRKVDIFVVAVPAKSRQHFPGSWFHATLHQPSWWFSMFWEAVSRASTTLWKCLWKSNSHTPKVFVVTLYAICCGYLAGKDESKWENLLDISLFLHWLVCPMVIPCFIVLVCAPRPSWHRAPTRWWPEPAPTLPAWRRCRARRSSRVWSEGWRDSVAVLCTANSKDYTYYNHI